MKKIIGKLSIGALLLSAAACSGDDLPVYEDVSRVYFFWATPDVATDHVDIKRFSFGYETPMKSDSTISISVRVMGRLSDEDRPLKAEVIWAESTVAPGDIEFLPSVIPANKRDGKLRVKVNNSAKLLEKTLWAKIRLAPNEYFHVDRNAFPYGDASYAGLEYNIEFDAKADIPNLWKDGTLLQQIFLNHSKVKEEWIYDQLGYTREDFTYDLEAVQAAMEENDSSFGDEISKIEDKLIPPGYQYGILSQLGRWLKMYKDGTSLYPDGAPGSKKAGEPLRDENDMIVEILGSRNETYN